MPIEREQAKAIQEIQAALVIAKKFPRNQARAWNNIMQSCQRITFAEQALYSYPRGDETVEGPSIRMAEMVAQHWGNIDFGIREVEQRDGFSLAQSYCWDMETNTRQVKEFKVPHKRFTRKGTYDLKDPRDIYELVANYGARRLRACILGVIPVDIVEAAVQEVKQTMEKGTGEPLVDRIRKMVRAFTDLNITQEQIEKRLRHKIDATSAAELVKLQAIYKSIRDGYAKPEEYFDVPKNADQKAAGINETLGVGEGEEQKPDTPQPAAGGSGKPPPPDPVINEQQLTELRKLLTEYKVDEKTFCRFCRVDNLGLLSARKYDDSVVELKRRKAKPKEQASPKAEPAEPAPEGAGGNASAHPN